jgi:hypothetical protein
MIYPTMVLIVFLIFYLDYRATPPAYPSVHVPERKLKS